MQKIKVNLIPSGLPVACYSSQYDEGRVIRCELYNGLQPYTLQENDVVTLNLRKPDNHVVTATLSATAGNKHVDLVTSEQMTAVFGVNKCLLKITNTGIEVGTAEFVMFVQKDVIANGDPSESVIEGLPQMVEEILSQSDVAQIDDTEASPNKTYSSEKIEEKFEDINEDTEKYLYSLYPYDRQLFNYVTMTPNPAIKKSHNSNNVVVESTSYRMYYIEINGKADEYYSFNIINPTAFNVNDLKIFATNSLEIGTTVKAGSTNVANKRGYVKLDGNYKYLCISIGSTLSGQDNITTECNEIVKALVIRVGTTVGYDTTYYTYEEYPVYKVDIPNDFVFTPDRTLHCGENLLTNDASSVGSGWSGSLATGYIHSGGTDTLEFTIPLTSGKKYIVSFDATGNNEDWLFIKLDGNEYVDIYNGLSTYVVGFVSDGTGKLTFKPTNQYIGTISNITVREYGAGNNPVVLPRYSDISKGLAENLTGFWNTSISPDGLQKNINGTRNVAIGIDALKEIKTGNRNIGIGTFALNKITSGDHNIAIGSDAVYMTTKTNDTIAIGYASLINGGDRCIAIGTMACNGSNGSAENVVAIGHQSAWYAGSHTVAVGYQAGYYTKGTGNVSVGKSAGNTLYVTGDRNTCIGREASFDGTGASSSNIKTINNSIAIGNEAKITKSNQAVIGSTAVTEIVFCGNKKINFNNDGTVTWETLT